MTRQDYDDLDGVYRLVCEDYNKLMQDGEAQELWHIATPQAQLLSRLASILRAYKAAHSHEQSG
jgi:hypothetical protein